MNLPVRLTIAFRSTGFLNKARPTTETGGRLTEDDERYATECGRMGQPRENLIWNLAKMRNIVCQLLPSLENFYCWKRIRFQVKLKLILERCFLILYITRSLMHRPEF